LKFRVENLRNQNFLLLVIASLVETSRETSLIPLSFYMRSLTVVSVGSVSSESWGFKTKVHCIDSLCVKNHNVLEVYTICVQHVIVADVWKCEFPSQSIGIHLYDGLGSLAIPKKNKN